MSETTETSNLRALLNALVAKRRDIGSDAVRLQEHAAANGYASDMTGHEQGRALRIIQEEIEAVRRAIADEARSPEVEAPEARESVFDQRTRGRTDIA